jgi:hypothetical protein
MTYSINSLTVYSLLFSLVNIKLIFLSPFFVPAPALGTRSTKEEDTRLIPE